MNSLNFSREKISYCNAEYAMFKVLKGLRGNGNICMLMRVVTDFNVFDIGILEIFVFYSLPF